MGSETFHLPVAFRDEIIAHARAGKPEEICGIVRGRDGRALEIVAARNVADERIENYTVDPQALLLQFAWEDAGDELAAIYHSHPVSVAYPSATDAWNANYPEPVYLICSLEYDDAPVIRGWRLVTHFEESEMLEWAELRRSLPFREVRRGLFGYFQPEASRRPSGLDAVGVEPPYYLVYQMEGGAVVDPRLVSVREVELLP